MAILLDGGCAMVSVEDLFLSPANRALRITNARLTISRGRRFWEEDERFLRIYDSVKGRTLLDINRLYILYQCVFATASLEGEIGEAGVYRGGSASAIAQAIELTETGKVLHLFDSFQGLPAPSSFDVSSKLFRQGEYQSDLDAVRTFLNHSTRTTCSIHPGWLRETLLSESLEVMRWSMVHIDLDAYQSVTQALQYFLPRLSPGGVVVVDDYGCVSTPGVEKACTECLASLPEKAIYLPTWQALIFKLESTKTD